ncbi:MAG: hypothetical protein QM705_10650 [Ancrocorticia sp.]
MTLLCWMGPFWVRGLLDGPVLDAGADAGQRHARRSGHVPTPAPTQRERRNPTRGYSARQAVVVEKM